jgi:hypothetical protein
MSISISSHIIITNACITVDYEFGVWLPHAKNTTKSTTKSGLSAKNYHYFFKEQTDEKVKKKDTFG